MAEPRSEPFRLALAALRERIRNGAAPVGARLNAVELADELRLSTTPVREALSRLVGEGLVEDRRGLGYFIRRFSSADVADLYRLNLAHLLIALEPRRGTRAPRLALERREVEANADPVERVETLFQDWIAAAGSHALERRFHALQVELGPVRRVERHVLADLGSEADALAALEVGEPRAARLAALRQFHGRRIRQADRLAACLEVDRSRIHP